MKINLEHQNKLEKLLTANTPSGLEKYISWHKEQIRLGFIKVKSCPATNCICGVLKKDALKFVCDEIYQYANDDHLISFYKKLYKKYD